MTEQLELEDAIRRMKAAMRLSDAKDALTRAQLLGKPEDEVIEAELRLWLASLEAAA
jgi:hypothetical protein